MSTGPLDEVEDEEEEDPINMRAGDTFRTITSADWKREVARARSTPNAVSAAIAKAAKAKTNHDRR